MQGGAHGAARQDFFKADPGTGGFTSVWTPHRIGTTWVRRPSRAKRPIRRNGPSAFAERNCRNLRATGSESAVPAECENE
jgi:hypothetical protein